MSVADDRKPRSSPSRPIKPSWRALTVRTVDGVELSKNEGLGMLVRWLRGEDTHGHVFVEALNKRVVDAPTAVNWARFPLQEATTAAWDGGRSSGIHPIPGRRSRREG